MAGTTFSEETSQVLCDRCIPLALRSSKKYIRSFQSFSISVEMRILDFSIAEMGRGWSGHFFRGDLPG